MNRRKHEPIIKKRKREARLKTILRESESITNLILGRTMLAVSIVYLIIWILNGLNFYGLEDRRAAVVCFGMIILEGGMFCLAEFTGGKRYWLRYVLPAGLLLGSGLVTFMQGDTVVPYLLLLVLTAGYSDRLFTLLLSLISAVEVTVVSWFGSIFFWQLGEVDLTYFEFRQSALIRFEGWAALNMGDYMTARDYALSRLEYRTTTDLMTLAVCCFCCLLITDRNYRILEYQHKRDEEQARSAIELNRNRAELLESNSHLLVSQIQPHFIYNVLNTIYHLCELDSSMAQEAVNDFSNYLRTNLNVLNSNTCVPFSKEREHIETYLRLEKMRFGDRLNVSWEVNTEDFELPELGLQPLVENAVKHGVCLRSEGGTVTIGTEEQESGYVITVKDDGIGFDITAETEGGSHVGIRNVQSRLEILCKADFTITSTIGKGTQVTIVIPKEVKTLEDTGDR